MSEQHSPSSDPRDIEEALQERGDELSLRAARYIRIKRHTEEGLRQSLRHMSNRSLEGEKERV